MSAEDASRISESLSDALSILRLIRIELRDLPKILELSIKVGITFYSASYLYAAKKHGLTLVTSDEELREAGRREQVRVISLEELLREKGGEVSVCSDLRMPRRWPGGSSLVPPPAVAPTQSPLLSFG